MNNILAVMIFLALVVVPPAFGGVKTHTLTVEERLERIEHINVTAEKKIRKDRYADKEVMAVLQKARKKMRAKWEDMTEEERKAAREKLRKNKAAREKMRKGMKAKHVRKGGPHVRKGGVKDRNRNVVRHGFLQHHIHDGSGNILWQKPKDPELVVQPEPE